jgi:hypothetical protein
MFVGGRAGPVVGQYRLREICPQIARVPSVTRRHCDHIRRHLIGEIIRRAANPIEKRLPNSFRFLPREPLECHSDVEPIAGSQRDRISPMRIEQVVGIEIDKPADQPAKSRLRGCNDRRLHQTDKRRQLVSL